MLRSCMCAFVQVLPIIGLVRGIPCAETKRRHLRKALLQYQEEFDTCKCAPCPNNAKPVLSGTECKCVCQTGTFGTNCETRAPDYTSGTAGLLQNTICSVSKLIHENTVAGWWTRKGFIFCFTFHSGPTWWIERPTGLHCHPLSHAASMADNPTGGSLTLLPIDGGAYNSSVIGSFFIHSGSCSWLLSCRFYVHAFVLLIFYQITYF